MNHKGKYGIPWLPFFLWAALTLWHTPLFAEEIITVSIPHAQYAEVQSELINAIESQGLVLSETSQFAAMLARTGAALGQAASPYQAGEIFHFCSARIAWQIANESASHIALCPLGIALYERSAEPNRIYLSYRPPAPDSPGKRKANALLADIVRQVVANVATSASD